MPPDTPAPAEAVAYRPSNGIEGMWFMDRFCDRCRLDEAFRRDEGDSCPIAAATMAVLRDDPRYPREWVMNASGPRCTAFEPMGETSVIRDPQQAEMPI